MFWIYEPTAIQPPRYTAFHIRRRDQLQKIVFVQSLAVTQSYSTQRQENRLYFGLKYWQRWDSTPRLRRVWCLKPAPQTARPRYPAVWSVSHRSSFQKCPAGPKCFEMGDSITEKVVSPQLFNNGKHLSIIYAGLASVITPAVHICNQHIIFQYKLFSSQQWHYSFFKRWQFCCLEFN